ncbi:MAG TPA: radical SAM protein [Kofleriaceae bacterium]|jgi:MoaA/NifB/PqqE/SkfB family radical SAM enzyme|nr:radical SAM protein [Kofleriaceae bacterium]
MATQPLRKRRFGAARIALDLVSAALDTTRPLVTNLIITRRCNLSCGYCFEYDKVSPPIPLATLRERIDHLARLRSVFVTLTGGESLLHPEADAIVAYVRARGMTPFLNTNGYLLTVDWIERLNRAGLEAMQISVDNVTPNAISKKSLKTLLPKLHLLAQHARFRVRINCVLGSSPPAEAVEVARTALALGFDVSTSLIRHGDGSAKPLDDATRAAYQEIRALGARAPRYLSDDFTMKLVENGTADWKCRAGARTFHVCENGLVHLCAPRVGNPGIPLAEYTTEHIRRAFDTVKPCAATCPIAYAHHASRLDRFRKQSLPALALPPPEPPLVQLKLGRAA